jgi:hypothetical protein
VLPSLRVNVTSVSGPVASSSAAFNCRPEAMFVNAPPAERMLTSSPFTPLSVARKLGCAFGIGRATVVLRIDVVSE